MRIQATKQSFAGTVTAVKARIRLCRSFDQIHHVYQGYTLVLDGTLDGEPPADDLRIGVGPKAHEKHQFRIGDQLTGLGVPVPDHREEWATHYKVSKLKFEERGREEQDVEAHPEGGVGLTP